jgi:D-methionine transport system substrate-binding protein
MSSPTPLLIKEAESLGLLGDVKVDITEISCVRGCQPVGQRAVISTPTSSSTSPTWTDWNANHHRLRSGGSWLTVHVEPLGLYSKKVNLDWPRCPTDAVDRNPGRRHQPGPCACSCSSRRGPAQAQRRSQRSGGPRLLPDHPGEECLGQPEEDHLRLKIDRPQLAASLDDPKVNVVGRQRQLRASRPALIPSDRTRWSLETADRQPVRQRAGCQGDDEG